MIINYRQAVPMVREYDENTLLLLHGEDFTDSSQYNLPIQNVGGVTSSSLRSKFGERSLFFGGSPAELTIVSDLFNFGSSDFTVDWWEYCIGSSATRFALSVNDDCGGLCAGGSLDINSLYISTDGDDWNVFEGAPAFNKTPNQWVHWAVIRNGNMMYTYRNGTLYWSGEISGSIFWNGTGLVIGSFLYDANHYFNGYIDEFRVSNIARWTGNFTPPTEAYER